MEQISFRCSTCHHLLKISADKAGRKAKCTKCGTELTIPSASQTSAPAEKAAASPAPAPPPPPKLALDEDEEEGGTYGLVMEPPPPEEKKKKRRKGKGKEDDEEEEEDEDEEEAKKEEEEKAKKEEEEKPKRRRRSTAGLRKAPMNPEKWEKVRAGILIVTVGMCVWLAAFVFHKIILLLGLSAPLEYAYIASHELVVPGQSLEPGTPLTLNKARFVVGLLSGSDNFTSGMWIFRVVQLLTLVQLGISLAGYGLCLAVPDRFGTRAVIIACLVLTILNILVALFLKFLPVTGALSYTLIPLVGPEINLIEANMNRSDPIHVTWCGAPFAEILLALLLNLMIFAEPVLFCIFLRAVALSLRDDVLDQEAQSLIRLGLSNGFIVMAYLLLMSSGTTQVLIGLLRVIYILGMAFFIGQLIRYILALLQARTRIQKKLKEG